MLDSDDRHHNLSLIPKPKMSLRAKALIAAYRMFPFSLKGDISIDSRQSEVTLSCVINFYGRIHLLEGILYSLSEQDLSKTEYEVILIEDRGGTEQGRNLFEKFKSVLNVVYYPLLKNYGLMGYSRNYGLSKAQGKYILFLDDDTVILQKNFLSSAINEFMTSGADGIVPCGHASYCLLKGRYEYHDPYFPSSRCMAYRRDILSELGGFISGIIGQEDVEFSIRFISAGKRYLNSNQLEYYHPPLVVNDLNKAAAVGLSFGNLEKRYPLVIYLMLLMNGLRYLPLICIPISMKWKMQGRFSAGFLKGILYSLKGKKIYYQESA